MPNPANPQNLNRYSYVINNPLRYVDPSGHRQCEEYQGTCLSESQMTNIWSNTTGNGNNNNDDDNEEDNNPGGGGDNLLPSLDLNSDPPPVDGYYCQSSTLACWANFAQDMATTVDFIFAGVEVVFVVGGCAAGPEGCVGGLLTSWMIFNSGPNQMEAALSGTSLLLTAVDDFSDGELGESTATSFTTFLLGGMNPDPIADLVIDGYASGYNHGFFNGLHTIMNGGSFIKNPTIYK